MSNLKIGLIGFGHIGKVHLENLLKFPNIEVGAIFSRTDKKDQIPKDISFYTNLNHMLTEQDLDAALICTPTHTHLDVASECSDNKLDILLEKPMANNLDACRKILNSVDQNKVKLLIGHVLRFWPTYGSVQKYLTENRIDLGEIYHIQSKRLSTFPWSRWFADQKKSGGVILDLAIHDIDYALWILGAPISVTCTARKITRYNREVYGEAIIKIEFEGGKMAECEVSWAKPEDFQFYTTTKIIGTESFIEFNSSQILDNKKWQVSNQFSSEDGYYNQLEHFLEVLSTKKGEFLVSGEEGMDAVKVCRAAIKSAEKKGKKIYIKELTP